MRIYEFQIRIFGITVNGSKADFTLRSNTKGLKQTGPNFDRDRSGPFSGTDGLSSVGSTDLRSVFGLPYAPFIRSDHGSLVIHVPFKLIVPLFFPIIGQTTLFYVTLSKPDPWFPMRRRQMKREGDGNFSELNEEERRALRGSKFAPLAISKSSSSSFLSEPR